ncbi:MAG TPA: cupin domain-containing protein [Actinomycetota bacterium]|nr:cupin domain-containing protein [Actinomycetota bacterium]
MTAPGSALERCVGDARRFAEEHWGRAPLLRSGPADRFGDLLTLRDVDHLVTGTLLRRPAFRLVKEGQPLDPKTYTQTIRIGGEPVERTARPDRVLDHFADGATIVLQALHRQWPPVAALCRDLELELTHPVQANAYVTPATSRGFAVHHDTHDVFVIQTHGHKEWRVYPPLVELAGREQPWSKDLGDPGRPILEAELSPGDCLYIPRGFPHDAVAREEVSIHVTVGILAYTWVDLWRRILRNLSDDVRFREALPVGFARDPRGIAEEIGVRGKDLQAWIEEAATPGAAEGFAERFWRTRRAVLPGGLVQLEELRRLGPDARFRRRPGSVFRVSVEGDQAVVLLGLRVLRMPSFVEPALRFLAESNGSFGVDDLPEGLDRESRMVLLRRLVREGALEVEGAAG